jgi:WD40 repeat protein
MKAVLVFFATLISIVVADPAPGQPKGKTKPGFPPSAVVRFALSPDGKTLALAERKLSVRLWSVADSKDIRSFPIGGAKDGFISALAFSPDGKTLAVAGTGRLETWDVESGKLLKTFNNPVKGVFRGTVKTIIGGPDDPRAVTIPDDVRCAVFSADGKRLFSGGLENVVRVWDPATGKETAKLLGHKSPVTHLALSRDGKTLASGTFYREIKIWDAESLKEVASLDNDVSVYGLVLSADGKKLLSTNHVDVTLWDISRKEVIRTFKGTGGGTGPVAFSPDEKRVVAKTIGYTVWDMNTAERLATFGQTEVASLAISPDGKSLFTCDRDGNVRRVELPKQ